MFEFLFFSHKIIFTLLPVLNMRLYFFRKMLYNLFYGLCNYNGVIRFDTVRRLAQCPNWLFRIISAYIHRNTLAVVYPIDIHLAAAISAIHQSYERVRFAPTIGMAPYLSSDALYVIKGFLVDNRRMGVLKD